MATGVWIPAFAGMTGCPAENHLNWNAIGTIAKSMRITLVVSLSNHHRILPPRPSTSSGAKMKRPCGTEFFDSRPILSHFVPFPPWGPTGDSTPTPRRSCMNRDSQDFRTPRPGHPAIPKIRVRTISDLQDSAIVLAGTTGGLRPPSAIDAREVSQGSGRRKCQQNQVPAP